MSDKPNEVELLARLEEQNRVLLSDAKAVPSLSVLNSVRHREGSISSSVSTESSTEDTRNGAAANNHSNSSPSLSIPAIINRISGMPLASAPLSDQWAHVLSNWDQYVKKRSYVGELIRKGVPDEYRPLIWQLYTGAYDSQPRRAYYSYLEVQSPAEKAIRRDIARTFPKHDLFKDENGYGQESLYRVIKAYSVHDREVGYCQGSGFIAGLLLMQLPELDAFAVLVQLMNEYRLREMYRPAMIELGVCMYQLERLLAETLPDLYTHFVTHSFAPSLYASAWFLTLFSTVLPIPMATRVMDMYIAEGFSFIFRMALSLLKFSEEHLLAADMESMVVFLQNEGPVLWEKNATALFENANNFKLNMKKMKKMEKEYLSMRSHEREDQIELRRLRTENGLLLQRLTRLEEECSVMADRLVQSQLIRAQEAETMISLRCELSILRRTCAANKGNEEHELATDRTADASQKDTNNNHVQEHVEEGLVVDSASMISDKSSCCVSDSAHVNGKVNEEKEVISEFVNGPKVDAESTASSDTPPAPEISETHIRDGPSMPKSNMTIDPVSVSTWAVNRQSRVSTLPRPKYHHRATVCNGDALAFETLHRLQTDLTLSRSQEADTKACLVDLRARYHELEELKTDQATRASEQIAVLKDELFGVKLRETEALARLEELRKRLEEIDSLWQFHMTQCKGTTGESKRASLWLGSHSSDSTEASPKVRLSDRIAEARYLDQISCLQQQITEVTIQREMADRRADRLDQRVTELLESRSEAEGRERGLRLELKQATQACAEIEAKRKADGVMWRSREMELTAQLAERRQAQLQLEYKYESLLATRSLQSAPPPTPKTTRSFDSGPGGRMETHENTSSKGYTLGSYLTMTRTNSVCPSALTGWSTPVESNPTTPKAISCQSLNGALNLDSPSKTSPFTTATSSTSITTRPKSGVTAMWKDIPPAVMTDSIGPLEDLCLVPDDPMITSVYLGTVDQTDT